MTKIIISAIIGAILFMNSQSQVIYQNSNLKRVNIDDVSKLSPNTKLPLTTGNSFPLNNTFRQFKIDSTKGTNNQLLKNQIDGKNNANVNVDPTKTTTVSGTKDTNHVQNHTGQLKWSLFVGINADCASKIITNQNSNFVILILTPGTPEPTDKVQNRVKIYVDESNVVTKAPVFE